MNYRHGVAVYRGEAIPSFRIIEHRRRWFALSGALIALSIVGLIARQLNFSIDFEGGAQISYGFATRLGAEDVRHILGFYGIEEAEVQVINGREVSIRTESLTESGVSSDALLKDLAEQAGITVDDISVEDIGPTWGREISRKAFTGLAIVLLAISAYIAWRFEWEMAIGAMVALVHDIVITAGLYALVGRQVTPETVIAILTILGFSLYDTVVIYDRVKENTESQVLIARHGYGGVVNLSLNEVLMRSLNTSLVVLLPILSLLLFGGETLKDFAFAMAVGVAIGAYSSVFVAAPVLVEIRQRQSGIRRLEERRVPAKVGAEASGTSRAGSATASRGDATRSRSPSRTGGGGRSRSRSRGRQRSKGRRR
jgi:preprotein translocase subunit SecF